MSTGQRLRLTAAEFLAFERKSELRHQLWDGEVFAMTGASRAHVLLVGNLLVEVKRQLAGRPCEAYSNDMRVHLPATGAFSYPDLAMVCGEPQFLDAELDTLLNPLVLVEVLSDTTEGFDRGRKFHAYQSIASLRHYVLVSQHSPLVEVLTREDASWSLRAWGPGTIAALDGADLRLDVDAIYRGVPLSQAPVPDAG